MRAPRRCGARRPIRPAEPRPALAALCAALAHVDRRPPLLWTVTDADARPLDRLVAVNVLREIDLLLRHAIVERANEFGVRVPARRSSLRLLPLLPGSTFQSAAHLAFLRSVGGVRGRLLRRTIDERATIAAERRLGLRPIARSVGSRPAVAGIAHQGTWLTAGYRRIADELAPSESVTIAVARDIDRLAA